MARKIVHQLIDDLDGTVLEPGSGETVVFSLDGVAYEIDLTDAHADELRATLATYVAAGRRLTASAGGATPRRKRAQGAASNTSAIREWAKTNGFTVSERGRIPADVAAAYEAAH